MRRHYGSRLRDLSREEINVVAVGQTFQGQLAEERERIAVQRCQLPGQHQERSE